MDLQAKIGDTRLKIRVVGVISTPVGYLFEKSDSDYIFLIGGKMMTGETSQEALQREIMEEVGMRVDEMELISVMENLYGKGDDKVHEISFIYKVNKIFDSGLPEGFMEVPISDLDRLVIKPQPIKDILKNANGQFKHIVVRQDLV